MERRGDDGGVPGVTVCWWPAKTGWRGKWKRSRCCCRRWCWSSSSSWESVALGLCWNSRRCATCRARSSRWKCKTATSLGIKWLNKIQLNPPSRLGYADRGIPEWRLMRNAARCRDHRDLPQRDRLRSCILLLLGWNSEEKLSRGNARNGKWQLHLFARISRDSLNSGHFVRFIETGTYRCISWHSLKLSYWDLWQVDWLKKPRLYLPYKCETSFIYHSCKLANLPLIDSPECPF